MYRNKTLQTRTLHDAINEHNLDEVRALIKAGAEVNQEDENCETPIFLLLGIINKELKPYPWYDAKKFSILIDILKQLVEAGADVNTSLKYSKYKEDKNQEDLNDKPLGVIFKNIKELYDSYSQKKKDIVLIHMINIVKLLLEFGAEVNIKINNLNSSPLHVAAIVDNATLLELMLSKNPDLKFKDSKGREVLEAALLYDIENAGSAETYKKLNSIDTLIKAGANAHTIVNNGKFKGYNLLHLSALRNDINLIELFLKVGIDANLVNERGETALHIATSKLNLESAEYLIKNGADVNARNIDGRTLLKVILKKGYHYIRKDKIVDKLIELFIKSGAEEARNGEKILFSELKSEAYSWEEHKEQMKIFIDAGLDVNSIIEPFYENNLLLMELEYATLNSVSKADINFIKYLIDKGINLNTSNTEGQAAIAKLLKEKRSWDNKNEVVKILIDAGADVNGLTIKEYGEDIPLLHYYSRVDSSYRNASLNLELLSTILKAKNIDLEVKDEKGNTALAGAAHNDCYYSSYFKDEDKYLQKQMIKLLIKAGADVNGLTIRKYGEDIPLLHYYSRLKDSYVYGKDSYGKASLSLELLSTILKAKNIDLEVKDEKGNTALVKVAHNDYYNISYVKDEDKYLQKEIIKLLIEAGADVNAKDNSGNTLLHWAVQETDKEMVEFILKTAKYIDLEVKNKAGYTALTYQFNGTYYNKVLQKEIIKLMIEAGANISVQSQKGNSALSYAVKVEDIELIKLFLKKGVDVNAKDMYGNTPLMKAYLNSEIAIILINNGARLTELVEKLEYKIMSLSRCEGLITYGKVLIAEGFKLLKEKYKANTNSKEYQKNFSEFEKHIKIIKEELEVPLNAKHLLNNKDFGKLKLCLKVYNAAKELGLKEIWEAYESIIKNTESKFNNEWVELLRLEKAQEKDSLGQLKDKGQVMGLQKDIVKYIGPYVLYNIMNGEGIVKTASLSKDINTFNMDSGVSHEYGSVYEDETLDLIGLD